MGERDDRAEAELPFEPEPDVSEDREDRGAHGDQAVEEQFRAHFRPDELGAAVFEIGSERRFDQVDRDLLGGIAAGLLLDADQNVVGGTEFLQRHFAETEPAENVAQLADLVRLRRLNFDQDATLEIDAVVHAPDREDHDRGNHQDRRDGEEDIAAADEPDIRGL